METENLKSLSTQDNININICEEIKKSIETIILYRSLYILKKKFDLHKPKIRTLYNSFNIDKNSNVIQYNSYQVSIENFVIITETIFKECNILITTLKNPKDIFLSNLFLNLNQKMMEMNEILNEIKNYITDENNSLVKKYNNLFYDKKIKPNIIKNILENKQNKKLKKENKTILNIEKNYYNSSEINNIDIGIISITNEKQNDIMVESNNENEDEEIQKTIVEYNRKGKIIKTYSRIINDNLTLSINKGNKIFEKRKKENILNMKFFKLSDNNDDFIGNHMQNIIENNNNFDFINEKDEYNIENDEKNKTVSIYSNLIDIENGRNFNNILYIETLPLIIADYMQQFPYYCIIEIENDLANELNILFDKELIEKMNNYEEALKNKNQNFISKELNKCEIMKNKIENNIKIYENLISEKKTKGENVIFLENMLERLLAKNIVVQDRISQLKTESNNNISKNEINTKNELNITNNNIELNNISKYSNIGTKLTEQNMNNNRIYNEYSNSKIKLSEIGKAKLTINQMNTNMNYSKNPVIKTNRTYKVNKINKTDNNSKMLASIKEIFLFYSRQHNLIGSKSLFEDLEKKMEHLTSSDFYKFCVEYSIPITRQKSLEIYKKSLTKNPSTYNKSGLMNFDEFLSSLKLIANYINQSKLDLLQKNILQDKEKLNSIEKRQIKLKETEQYNNSVNLNNNKNINNKYNFDKGEFYFECEKKKLINSIFNLENKYNNEKGKTENEIMNNLLLYIGINSNNDYKSKLKGFLLPFKIHEKQKSLVKAKYGIGSKLESEIKEASKIYILEKNEQKKLKLSKEVLEKQMSFKNKKKMFKLKNEILINNLNKKINRKYSDKLSDLKNELKRKEEENLEIKKKEEYVRKNIISWNKLDNFDVNNLDIDEDEKKLFIDSDNSDEEIINKISNGNINDNNAKKKTKKKRLNKNNSAIELIPKKKMLLPPIINKENIENDNIDKEDFNNINNNDLNEILNKDYSIKKSESNFFGDLSAITDNSHNINKSE